MMQLLWERGYIFHFNPTTSHVKFYVVLILILMHDSDNANFKFLVRFGCEVSHGANKGRVDVSSRLRLLVVIPVIGEIVTAIRAADYSPNKDIRVGRSGVEVVESIVAGNAVGVRMYGRHRGTPVVHMLRKSLPKPHHVRHLCWIVS